VADAVLPAGGLLPAFRAGGRQASDRSLGPNAEGRPAGRCGVRHDDDLHAPRHIVTRPFGAAARRLRRRPAHRPGRLLPVVALGFSVAPVADRTSARGGRARATDVPDGCALSAV
jgi:hypothetical protein